MIETFRDVADTDGKTVEIDFPLSYSSDLSISPLSSDEENAPEAKPLPHETYENLPNLHDEGIVPTPASQNANSGASFLIKVAPKPAVGCPSSLQKGARGGARSRYNISPRMPAPV